MAAFVTRLGAQPQAGFTFDRNFASPAPVGAQVIYRMVPLFRTADEVRSRAAQLGLQPQSIRSMRNSGATYTVQDASFTFTLDTDRQLETMVDNRVLRGQYGSSRLVPTQDECRAVALSFLGQKRLVEGTADEGLAYERTNELLDSFRGVADTGPGAHPVVVMREVVFAKTIGGVPCTGPGTHLSVFVGDRGKVMGYLSNWWPPPPRPMSSRRQ